MKTTLIKLPIVSFRRIESPFEQEGKRMYVAVVQAKNLPAELDEWRKINPRDPSVTSGVAKKIARSFEDSPKAFLFKNRGITLLAERTTYDGENKELAIEFSDPIRHGMLDGGHTYRIIRTTLESLDESERKDLDDAHVRLEILEGFTDPGDVVDVVEARNTSTQVKDQSLEELRGHFDAIKLALKNESYADRIAYREIELAEDGSRKDIDIKEILSYLVCFDVEAFDGKKHPIIAYNSKGAVLSHVKDNRERLNKYLVLLPQILQLRDLIYAEMPKTYNSAVEGKFGRLTGVIEISGKKNMTPVELPFGGQESTYVIPSAFVYPILASLRNLVDCNSGKCSWKGNRDPIKFFDDLKEELIQRVVEQAKEFRNPNKLGRDNATWGRCYDYVALEVLKLKI